MTVLSKISSEEYKVITAPGKLYRIKKDKLITYAERYGLTNAKLVNRETGVVISLLSGNIYQEPIEELVVVGQNSKLQKQEQEQEQTTKRNKENANSIKEKNEEKIKKPNENENKKEKEDTRLVATKTETVTPTVTAAAVPETVENEKEVEKETELEKLMKVIQFLKATYNKREQASLVTLDGIGKVCIDNNIHSVRDIKKDELDSLLDEIKMYADTNFSIEEWESASLFG